MMVCKITRNKLNTYCMLVASLFLFSCASEIDDYSAIKEMGSYSEKQRARALDIHESNNLMSEGEIDAYGSEGNLVEDLDVFEAEKGTGRVVNPNVAELSYPATQNGSITLNFENADLREVVKFIMTDILALNYTLSPNVQGRVTLQTSEPLSEDDMLPTLDMLLKVNGAVMITSGELVRIMPQAEANRANLVPQTGKIARLKPGYQIRIIQLKYMSAIKAQETLAPFFPDGSLLQVDAARNVLVVAGTGQELANIQQTVDTFDVDWLKGMSIGVYRLQNVNLDEVLPELESLFGPSGSTPFAGMFNFVPMQSSNAIMVITSESSYLIEAKRWLERLDQTGSSDLERLYVYRVQNGRAEDLANVLSGIFEGSTQTVTSSSNSNREASLAPGETGRSVSSNSNNTRSTNNASSNNTSNNNSSNNNNINRRRSSNDISGAYADIVADEVNNSLVIKATPANYDLVLQALRQIDVPKLQVLLDVVIAEITLQDELSYGFKFWLDDSNPSSRETITDVGVSSGGFNYSLVSGTIEAEITALVSKGLAQFLSTPSLMVLDNETATMSVGDQISVTGEVVTDGDNSVQSVSYLNTGVDLEVTPRVNAGGLVVLDITQNVSRASKTDFGANNNPDIADREISTAISTRDGETVVLGGLIQEEADSARSGLPILSEIPILGAPFRGTSRNTKRTELLIMVTPRVSRNSGDSLRLTKEFKERMSGLKIFNEDSL